MSNYKIKISRKRFCDLTELEISEWKIIHRQTKPNAWAFMAPGFSEAINACSAAVEVIVLSDGSKPVGFMPIQRQSGIMGRFGLYEPAGSPMCDYFGLVAVPEIRITWEEILFKAKVPCLVFTHLDEVQENFGLRGEQPRIGYRTRVAGDGISYWATLKKNDKELVKDVDRRVRKIERDFGAIDFEMQTNSVEEAMDVLIKWKCAQYVRTEKNAGALLRKECVNVLRYLMMKKVDGAYPMLSTLRSGGKLIAVHFGLLGDGVLHRWFPAYDPNYSRYSPGKILLKEMLLASNQYGVTCIDRGDGDTDAKRDFSNEEHFFYKGLIGYGLLGTGLKFAQRVQWRLMR